MARSSQTEKDGLYQFIDEQTEEILLLFWLISEESENQIDGLSADIGERI
jgi:hypothetical protein